MNQRHIHDDDYSIQDPIINNLESNKKVSGPEKQYFSNDDSQYNNNNNGNNTSNNNGSNNE